MANRVPRNHKSLDKALNPRKYLVHFVRDERKDLPEDLRQFFGFKVDCYMCFDHYSGRPQFCTKKEAVKLTLEEAKYYQERHQLSEHLSTALIEAA